MSRLSDRAFHIVRAEIERRYTERPADQIERVILLSRLEALRERKGPPMTRVQIWEVLSDVAPNFDQKVLMEAESVEADSPLIGVSIGVGAVAVLVATAIGMDASVNKDDTEALVVNDAASSQVQDKVQLLSEAQTVSQEADYSQTATDPEMDRVAAQRVVSQKTTTQEAINKGIANQSEKTGVVRSAEGARTLRSRFSKLINWNPRKKEAPIAVDSALEAAESLGWQAALRSQNPPHGVQYWKETAALWEEAIAELSKIPPRSADYIQAQKKKITYQANLKEINKRQEMAAARAERKALEASQRATPATGAQTTTRTVGPENVANPQFSNSSPSEPSQTTPVVDPVKAAKEYGWRAAVASQNAPHPPEKWADISRLWQTALSKLDNIDVEHPRYEEAQRVKAAYQLNLAAIRDRYQREQTATQSLQSLQASLTELNGSLKSDAVKYGQMEAILEKLKTIPVGTEAHRQAQKLIVDTQAVMSAIALEM